MGLVLIQYDWMWDPSAGRWLYGMYHHFLLNNRFCCASIWRLIFLFFSFFLIAVWRIFWVEWYCCAPYAVFFPWSESTVWNTWLSGRSLVSSKFFLLVRFLRFFLQICSYSLHCRFSMKFLDLFVMSKYFSSTVLVVNLCGLSSFRLIFIFLY